MMMMMIKIKTWISCGPEKGASRPSIRSPPRWVEWPWRSARTSRLRLSWLNLGEKMELQHNKIAHFWGFIQFIPRWFPKFPWNTTTSLSHMLHVWKIYQPWPKKNKRVVSVNIYHSWSLWAMKHHVFEGWYNLYQPFILITGGLVIMKLYDYDYWSNV